MKPTHTNRGQFFRLMPGTKMRYPGFSTWVLWQPLKKRFGFWWKSGMPFWLDEEGFVPIPKFKGLLP